MKKWLTMVALLIAVGSASSVLLRWLESRKDSVYVTEEVAKIHHAVKNPKMEILTVESDAHYSDFPVRDWDSVVKILQVYLEILGRDIPLNVVDYAQDSVSKTGYWSGVYEYRKSGQAFGGELPIRINLQERIYIVEVRDWTIDELTKRLNLELCLQNVIISIGTRPLEADKFCFDFDMIGRKLSSATFKRIEGEFLLSSLMKQTDKREDEVVFYRSKKTTFV